MKHSHSLAAFAALALTVFFAIGGGAQQPVPARATAPPGGAGGRGRGAPPETDTLGAGPWDLTAGRGRVHVSVVTKGVDHPWGIAFVPDGGLLITERPGRLRVFRNGALDPTPIGPLPQMLATGLGGLLDVSLHPSLARIRSIYLTYARRREEQ